MLYIVIVIFFLVSGIIGYVFCRKYFVCKVIDFVILLFNVNLVIVCINKFDVLKKGWVIVIVIFDISNLCEIMWKMGLIKGDLVLW